MHLDFRSFVPLSVFLLGCARQNDICWFFHSCFSPCWYMCALVCVLLLILWHFGRVQPFGASSSIKNDCQKMFRVICNSNTSAEYSISLIAVIIESLSPCRCNCSWPILSGDFQICLCGRCQNGNSIYFLYRTSATSHLIYIKCSSAFIAAIITAHAAHWYRKCLSDWSNLPPNINLIWKAHVESGR